MDSFPTTTCSVGVSAWSALAADATAIAAWRRQPIVIGAETKPAALLKHADDQTIVAVHAVLDAIERAKWQGQSFADWGVLAGGSFFGRGATAEGMRRFRAEGAWAVSPHVVPNNSLHAPSGALSHILGMHGPNFGVGSSVDTTADALLLALTLLSDGALPGVWVALTQYEPEWIPNADGAASSSVCHAVALALTSARSTAVLTIEPCEKPLLPISVNALTEGLRRGSGRWLLSDRSLAVEVRLNGEVRP